MPSVSKKQHNLMAAVANNPAISKKTKIPQSVGKEFLNADRGRKFSGGGEMKAESKGMVKKEVSFMKKKGAPKSMIKHEESEMAGMKKGGMKKMASGGMTSMGAVRTAAPSRDGVASKGKTKGTMIKMAGNSNDLKKGGMAKKMNKGGRAC
jgi:hypothetical protein